MPEGRIFMCVTIDWEGDHTEGLSDLTRLRRQFAHTIPCTHFVCPAYKSSEWKSIHRSGVIKKQDELALHLHPHKKIIQSIPNIPFRFSPNFYNRKPLLERLPSPSFNLLQALFVSGRGVPLTAYQPEELSAILDWGSKTLQKQYPQNSIRGFRAGGWIINDALLYCLEKAGFQYDSSAVAVEILSEKYHQHPPGNLRDNYGDYNGNFTDMVLSVWGNKKQDHPLFKNHKLKKNHPEAIRCTTQSFPLNSKIRELPNNGGLSDFASADKTMLPLFLKAKEYIRENPNQNFYINIGCHQEGSTSYKLELFCFLNELLKNASNRAMITFTTLSEYQQIISEQDQG